jgi:hypothetical protein
MKICGWNAVKSGGQNVYLDTDGVALYLVKVGVLRSGAVEELAPQQLTVQRERRLAFLDLEQKTSLVTSINHKTSWLRSERSSSLFLF